MKLPSHPATKMVTNFNIATLPPNGWTFRQPQTGWVNPQPMISFSHSVDMIIKHRQQNPAITAKHKLSTDYDTVASELVVHTKKRLGITDPKLGAFTRVAHRVNAVVAGARNAVIGAANLLAWTDDGKTVSKEQAAERASICAEKSPTGRCPMNGSGDWRATFTNAVAVVIKKQLEARDSLGLNTPYDQKLGVCDACACPLPLKVWSPLKYALRKMSDDTKSKLPAHCWLLTEQDETKNSQSTTEENPQS